MEELQPLYVSLASEVDDPQVTVISSQCMNCHEMLSRAEARDNEVRQDVLVYRKGEWTVK
ncbi:hypothetical protein E2C01_072548 [Portunus trituberculatus]|uniref:Uncharacterized protein n=1 Tax=Portunus trituberculatus TaxID=210409 RepID=A0A5B7I705_PORTR|nr:hypothetical protein [Portunus trituberculatus]